MTEDGKTTFPGNIFTRKKAAALSRIHSDGAKVVRSHSGGIQHFRLTATGQTYGARFISRKMLESLSAIAHQREQSGRYVGFFDLFDWRGDPERHQSIGITQREWIEEHRLNDTENCRVGAYAKRERQQYHGCKDGPLEHAAQTVTYVLY